MFQNANQVPCATNVNGFKVGTVRGLQLLSARSRSDVPLPMSGHRGRRPVVADDGWVRRLAGPVRHVAKLLFSVLLTFLGLTCVTFFIGRVIPIDPVLAIVGDKASRRDLRPGARRDRARPADPGAVLALSGEGAARRFRQLRASPRSRCCRTCCGCFPATLELSLLALIIGVVFGIPLGVVAATHRGRWQDQVIRFGSLLGYSMPVFWLGLVGLLAVLRQARLGRGAGTARCGLRRHRAHRHRADHRRQPGRRRVRRVLERAQPPDAARLDPRLSVARLRRADDAQLHAGAVEAGIHAGDAGKGLVAVPRGVGACARQCLGAARRP